MLQEEMPLYVDEATAKFGDQLVTILEDMRTGKVDLPVAKALIAGYQSELDHEVERIYREIAHDVMIERKVRDD